MARKNIYTYLDLAADTLRRAGKPLTSEEIWQLSLQYGLTRRLRKIGKTPWATIQSRIYVNMRDDPDSPFTRIGRRPVRLFLKELAEKVSPNDLEKQASRPEEVTITRLSERSLHPVLAYFAYAQLGVYCKTIKHERSSKTKKSEWLHPNVVGLYMPVDAWEEETLALSREIGATITQLYAFEMKLNVAFANLRESFFQAVSNSSWANEGYLVAARFSTDGEFQSELKRLSDAFGIGVIRLDIEDPDSSEVVYRSRQRTELDWETINKLAALNPDFKHFMRAVQDALKIHRINPGDFDPLESEPERLVARLAGQRGPSRGK